MQSKKNSMIESLTNGLIAYLISVVTACFVFPLFGYQTSMIDNFGITACFTFVTVIRGYIVRRWFARREW